MAKSKGSKKSSKAVDTKMAAANDQQPEQQAAPKQEATAPVEVKTGRAAAVAEGAKYRKLAGNPSKAEVISVFGQAGYAGYSWVTRAQKMGITVESLCSRFADKSTRDLVKTGWEGLPKPERKRAAKA